MADTLKIISTNCQGLNNKKKRIDVFENLKKKNANIYCLQDTHFTEDLENKIKTEWGSANCFFSSHRSNARGVAILFQNNFEFKLLQQTNDKTSGNLLALKININGKTLTIITLYGPNTDSPDFVKNIFDIVKSFDSDHFSICGDWNLVQKADMDLFNYKHINNPKSRDVLLEIIEEENLLDPWRDLNPDNKRYTWRQPKPVKQARLDFFLLSRDLEHSVKKAGIDAAYRSDHSPTWVSLKLTDIERGRGFWKFNNSLLHDQEYVNKVKKIIAETKEQYKVGYDEQGKLLFNIDDQLFFETLLLMIRGYTIKYSSHKKKERDQQEKKLTLKIETLNIALDSENDKTTKSQIIKKLNEANHNLETINKIKTEGIMMRAKSQWKEEGERPTKYFLSLENRTFLNKAIAKIEKSDGRIITATPDLIIETQKFYQNLYTKQSCSKMNLDELFKDLTIPKLNLRQQQEIEGELQYDEVLFSLKNMKNNKSPGPSGFSVEFYKFFWHDLNTCLLRSLNLAYKKGELSTSQKQGLITCIPKQNKPKQFKKNWRPISLLNVSYKIGSATIANRIKKVLPTIISEDQKGFMSNRFMGECTRLIYDIMDYTECMEIPGLLLLIDFEKAFDSVDWEFIKKALDYFNFGPSIKHWITTFYHNITSSVLVNGFSSTFFEISRGCRQGDPLSPYIFLICAEILSIMLKNNDKIKGINIGNTEYLLSQFADDTTLILDGSEACLQASLQTLKLYASFSGLRVNTNKTQVLWIGSKRNSTDILCKTWNLNWTKKSFTILGIEFTHNLAEMVERNYKDKLKNIKILMNIWLARDLTAIGRITVLKSLLLPKLNHLFSCLPNPSENIIKELETLCFRFIWKQKPDKISRKIVIRPYEEGGIRAPDIRNIIASQKLAWVKRIFNSEPCSKVNTLLRLNISNIHMDFLQSCETYIQDRVITPISNEFWKDVLKTWGKYLAIKGSNVKNSQDILSQPIWNNCNIKIQGRPFSYRKYINKGIKLIDDLLDSNGKFIEFKTFTRLYNCKTNFLEYAGIINSINTFIKSTKIQINAKLPAPIMPFFLENLIGNRKGCREFYDILQQSSANSKLFKYRAKWETDLDTTITPKQWGEIYSLHYNNHLGTKQFWFQYSIINRILPTNDLLHKIQYKDTDMCDFCTKDKETLTHFFYDCPTVKPIWESLKIWIENKTGNTINFSKKIILLGYPEKRNSVLNTIITTVKFNLYKSKLQNTLPNLQYVKQDLINVYNIDKYSHYSNCNYSGFMKFWSSCHLLF